MPEEEQKRIENMEEESKKRQYSADFDNAINAAQKAEEGIKQKEKNHVEEITKAKERNATIHAEQLLKRKQKKLEERNKTAVRHEQNLKRDAVIEIKQKAEEAKKNEQNRKLEKIRRVKAKWAIDHYNAMADFRRNMITDISQNYTDCTGGNGKFDNISKTCKCHYGFTGPLCAYKVLHHGHGRFVGSSECEHGEPFENGDGCNCTEGFEIPLPLQKMRPWAERMPKVRQQCWTEAMVDKTKSQKAICKNGQSVHTYQTARYAPNVHAMDMVYLTKNLQLFVRSYTSIHEICKCRTGPNWQSKREPIDWKYMKAKHGIRLIVLVKPYLQGVQDPVTKCPVNQWMTS